MIVDCGEHSCASEIGEVLTVDPIALLFFSINSPIFPQEITAGSRGSRMVQGSGSVRSSKLRTEKQRSQHKNYRNGYIPPQLISIALRIPGFIQQYI